MCIYIYVCVYSKSVGSGHLIKARCARKLCWKMPSISPKSDKHFFEVRQAVQVGKILEDKMTHERVYGPNTLWR